MTKEEIEHLKKEQDVAIVEKAQIQDDKVWLENVIAFSYQEIPDITMDMFTEAKVLQLG